jgi:hypothetical protein
MGIGDPGQFGLGLGNLGKTPGALATVPATDINLFYMRFSKNVIIFRSKKAAKIRECCKAFILIIDLL